MLKQEIDSVTAFIKDLNSLTEYIQEFNGTGKTPKGQEPWTKHMHTESQKIYYR